MIIQYAIIFIQLIMCKDLNKINQAYKYLYAVNSYDFNRLRNSHIGNSIVKYQLCKNIFG